MSSILLIAHLGFVLTGVVTTLLGPILPALSLTWSLTDAQAGRFFAAQFLGSFAGAIASNRLMGRFGCRRVMLAGFVVMAIGVAGTGAASPALGMACVFGYGLGLGLNIPAANLLVAELVPRRRAAALNVLNFAWTLGAVLAPPVVRSFLLGGHLSGFLAGLAVLLALAAVGVSAGHPDRSQAGEAPIGRLGSEGGLAERRAFVLLTSILLFLYVGVENGISGWLISYASRLPKLSRMGGTVAQSTFWGAILLGRLAAPALLRGCPRRLVLWGLGVASGGMALFLSAGEMAVFLAGVFLAGAGLAAVFPTAVALFSERLGGQARVLGGWVFALGGVGGAAIPWLIGYLSTALQSLRVALCLPLLCSLAMIIVQLRISAIPLPGAAALAASESPLSGGLTRSARGTGT